MKTNDLILISNEIYYNAKQKKLLFSVAESLTGGAISAAVVMTSGISQFFYEGIVAYGNESKIKRLNVPKEEIQKYGAVSEAVAISMAKGLIKDGVCIAVSTTGIAGPSGETKNKKVGLVYIGLADKNEAKAFEFNFEGSREDISYQATICALKILNEALKKF